MNCTQLYVDCAAKNMTCLATCTESYTPILMVMIFLAAILLILMMYNDMKNKGAEK